DLGVRCIGRSLGLCRCGGSHAARQCNLHYALSRAGRDRVGLKSLAASIGSYCHVRWSAAVGTGTAINGIALDAVGRVVARLCGSWSAAVCGRRAAPVASLRPSRGKCGELRPAQASAVLELRLGQARTLTGADRLDHAEDLEHAPSEAEPQYRRIN